MGFLDEALRSVSDELVKLFVDNPATVKVVKSFYDSTSDTTTNTTRVAQMKFTPPSPVSTGMLIGDSGLLATDLVTYTSALALEAMQPPLDPRPSSNVKVYITMSGRDHSVLKVKDWKSGDQSALIEFILRS